MIEIEPLTGLAGVSHGFFTREGGVSQGIYKGLNCGFGSSDAPENVAENRARVARSLSIAPAAILTVYQVHSPDAVQVTSPWSAQDSPRVDAMVTDRPGLALGILAADCAPVLFADAGAGIIGAAHAGWKGALYGVLENTLKLMESLGARRDRISAAIGPCISQAAYEVGVEFRETFIKIDPSSDQRFAAAGRPAHFMFDLPGYVATRLREAGVGQVGAAGLCTYQDEARFFSFRRTTHRGEPDYGRQISVILLDAS